jgi:hypothetical protein
VGAAPWFDRLDIGQLGPPGSDPDAAGEGDTDLEPTVRRWLALARSEPWPIGDLNRFVARLAKFSRAEIRKMRRRIVVEPGPADDRQEIVGFLSLAHGAEKPVLLTPEETLALPRARARRSSHACLPHDRPNVRSLSPNGKLRGSRAPAEEARPRPPKCDIVLYLMMLFLPRARGGGEGKRNRWQKDPLRPSRQRVPLRVIDCNNGST